MSTRRTIAVVLAVCLLSALRVAVHAEGKSSTQLPTELSVPEGQRLAFQFHGEGVQIYACQANDAATPAWVLTGPEAKLFDARGRDAGKHYAGPTWEGLDRSTVVGTKLAAHPAGASDVPWLLLQAASHTGNGSMSKITYVQRLDTKGGVAPALGCDASHVGETSRVAYSASYLFFEAKPHAHDKFGALPSPNSRFVWLGFALLPRMTTPGTFMPAWVNAAWGASH